MAPGARRTVLVTGGAGGLGGATSTLLAARGWQVFVGDLDGDALRSAGGRAGTTPVVLDVTDGDSVAEAVEAVAGETDGLDAIVHFAGVLEVGSLVDIEAAALARVLDVNVMGTYRVTKAFFDLLHARRGRVVTISSETGVQRAAPFNGPYAMSKHAVEAYSDALRRELSLLGMRVVTIRPGPFRTGMVGGMERKFAAAAAASPHFAPVLRRMMGRLAAEEARAHDPAVLAVTVFEAVTAAKPKIAYDVRHDPRRALLDRLPVAWADAVFTRVLSGRRPPSRGG